MIRRRFDLIRLGRRLRHCARPSAPAEIVSLAFALRIGTASLSPIQVRAELEAFLARVCELEPRRVLEIGTAYGGTLFALAAAAHPDAHIASLDLPSPMGYPPERELLYRAFARAGQRLDLVRADSHLPATRDRIVALMGGSLDLLFIDGDHTYEGVRRDWELYGPLVRAGGLVAFHDIVPGSEDVVGGVPRFWAELREATAVDEIVAEQEQGGYGIGVVRVGQADLR